MQDKFNTDTYGTHGLPKFGGHAIDGTRKEAITEVENAFNNLMSTVKKYTVSGNEVSLKNFGLSLEQAWTPALKAVAGKPIVS
jgi:hypothetical protein